MDNLTFDIPNYQMTIILRNAIGDITSTQSLDVWEAKEMIAQLYGNLPGENKFKRDIILPFQKFLGEKGILVADQNQIYQIIDACEAAYAQCKKKSESGSKSHTSIGSQTTHSASILDD